MFEELIKRLRECTAEQNGEKTLWNQAADAIEELQGAKCQHYIRNVHDRGDDSLCNKWMCEIASLPKWIPVTERLPPISEEVIVFADRTTIRIWSLERYHPTIADVFWEREDGYHEEDVDVVTHWMPLPQPPEDGET